MAVRSMTTVRTPCAFSRSAVRTMSDDLPICRAASTLQYSPTSVKRSNSSSAARVM
jgi:hypothetical protein